MRGYLPDYTFDSANSLKEALSFCEMGTKPFAGGTDLMVLFEAGLLVPGKYFDISGLKELKGIKISKSEVTLGALTTYSQIRDHATLTKQFPILGLASREVGAIAIQNRGTIGGNIANASPAADFPPGLLVYDAKIHLVSKKGIRTLDYSRFHLGYKKTELRADELILSISLNPEFQKYHHLWRKVGNRRAQAISKTMMAGIAKVTKKSIEDIRIAFGSVGPTAVRCSKVEGFLKGKPINTLNIQKAKQLLAEDIHPIDDIRSTGKYRLRVSQNVLEEFLCGIG
jgi:CO/xanthine dehydrogenase FAD-binding subunit